MSRVANFVEKRMASDGVASNNEASDDIQLSAGKLERKKLIKIEIERKWG